MIQNLKQLKIQKEETSAAKKLALESQLQLLQQQVNPHFLFNALNSLKSLIAIDTPKARKMVNYISEFLRESLKFNYAPLKLLSEEITILENYLKIQKIRWGKDLIIINDVSNEVLNYKVPSLILQPLAENAIKHGMNSKEPLIIELIIKKKDNKLLISVRNNGQIVNMHNARDGGNKNIAKRLQLLYGNNASFSLFEDNGKAHSDITIKI